VTAAWVTLLAHGPRAAAVADELAPALPPPFQVRVREAVALDLDALLDRQRGQLDARALLQRLPPAAPGVHLLALVEVDLFLPVLTYVLGASELGRRRSVLSLARLVPPDAGPGLLLYRASVEAVHELGHGLGLVHCAVPACPMHRTLWPEAIDLKQPLPCPSCLAAIRAGLEGSLLY
jgi:archaemetzincin